MGLQGVGDHLVTGEETREASRQHSERERLSLTVTCITSWFWLDPQDNWFGLESFTSWFGLV